MTGVSAIKDEGADAEKAAIEAFIAAKIIPVLPKYSTTQIMWGVKSLRDGELPDAFPSFILVYLIHKLIKQLRESMQPMQLLILRAILAERLQAGNCHDQAHLAAVKLVQCDHINHVTVILDYSQNHAYLEVHTKGKNKYRYDPWLSPANLFAEETHDQELKKISGTPSIPERVHRQLFTRERLDIFAPTLVKHEIPPISIRRLKESLVAGELPRQYARIAAFRAPPDAISAIAMTTLQRLNRVFASSTTVYCCGLLQKMEETLRPVEDNEKTPLLGAAKG